MHYQDEDVPATINDHDDGYAAAAVEADRHLIKGQIIKFVDGKWTLNKQPIAKEAQYIPIKLTMCWVRWENNRPAEHVWPRSSGFLPSREALSKADEVDWPIGLDDKPKDPWQNTRLIYLTDLQTAETHTFTNSTAGIRHCYSSLARAVATMRKAHPLALPIVELDAVPMKTKIGTKLRPHLKIVSWKQVSSPEVIEPPEKSVAEELRGTLTSPYFS